MCVACVFFFSSRRRHTRWTGDWSSDVCSSDLSGKIHREIMLDAARGGLETVYDQSWAKTPRSGLEQPVVLSPQVLQETLARARERHILPSFLDSQDVFIASQSIPMPSDGLICVIRFGDSDFYGISGRRAWSKISFEEFTNWSHSSLSE